MPKTDPELDATKQRQVAVALFNRAWSLLELESRTEEQVDELVHAAHASAYHWMMVGTSLNRARSEWQCSRVYAVLVGRAGDLARAEAFVDLRASRHRGLRQGSPAPRPGDGLDHRLTERSTLPEDRAA